MKTLNLEKLSLKDFKSATLNNLGSVKGGTWTATGGGHKQVLMQSFDYGSDSTDGAGTTRYHCITNSTINDGSGAYPGPCK